MAVVDERDEQNQSRETRKIMGALLRRRRMEAGTEQLKDVDTDEIRRRWLSEKKKNRSRSY